MSAKKKTSFLDQILYKGEEKLRLWSGANRILPEYLIIGAKCGTTSPYNYLILHPAVFSCFKGSSLLRLLFS
ncbi:MAG: hypothetical protein IPJ26_17230 [Bacteroidetes bacterium]|nr:hypothetical protein [Bacteroidota bacterium]